MLSTVATRLASPLLLAAGDTAFAAGTGRDWMTAFAAGLLLGVGSALWMRRSKRELAAELAPTPEIAARRLHEHVVAAIADSNPDAVVFFSDTGNIRYANPTARELFFDGVSPEGQNFLRLMAG